MKALSVRYQLNGEEYDSSPMEIPYTETEFLQMDNQTRFKKDILEMAVSGDINLRNLSGNPEILKINFVEPFY